ncbi:unnamed protein product [Microthlaspi erraticum]|uniref:Aminotransferase class I/classII large domain-containing protein n=1 Tax=Microthlaspi erraticum TaxID=1685480 RepID=A0A6D2KDJ2_9BRAS|nr:unnamed protein product [Microthlaspi erraticum]
MSLKAFDDESLNENVKNRQYAVRGELYFRASELQKEGKKIILTNVGNPHALGQKPLTFPRQILVPVPQYPLYSATISLLGGTLVPYYLEETENWGLDVHNLRQSLAQARSQGITVSYVNSSTLPLIARGFYKTHGLMAGSTVMRDWLFLETKCISRTYTKISILLSVPRWVLMDMGAPISKESQLVSFHTVSKGCWGECGQRGGYFEMTNIPPRVFLVMQTVEEIYKISSIALSPNVPAQIFVRDMGAPISKESQLVSFHTVSKGCWGECGQRGGYFEMTNIPPRVFLVMQTVEEIYKISSIALSPNVPAQIFVSKGILESLRRRAKIMIDGFNSWKNAACNFTEGAMYSFPLIKLPSKAVQAAKQAEKGS